MKSLVFDAYATLLRRLVCNGPARRPAFSSER
jgi:hypothetical protein